MKQCSIEGCERPHSAFGWCAMHGARWRRTGDPEFVSVIRGDLRSCVGSKIDQTSASPCWQWTGKPARSGYGRQTVDGRSREAHLVVYELMVGPIPEGMTLDHECHNEAARRGECVGGTACQHRLCVNPAHLVPKPMAENIAASPKTQATINSAKTHCLNGHEFDEANTYWYEGRKGVQYRDCRACRRQRYRERHA